MAQPQAADLQNPLLRTRPSYESTCPIPMHRDELRAGRGRWQTCSASARRRATQPQTPGVRKLGR
eukprot:927116-Alexandrium_andersonii.AAC.1